MEINKLHDVYSQLFVNNFIKKYNYINYISIISTCNLQTNYFKVHRDLSKSTLFPECLEKTNNFFVTKYNTTGTCDNMKTARICIFSSNSK